MSLLCTKLENTTSSLDTYKGETATQSRDTRNGDAIGGQWHLLESRVKATKGKDCGATWCLGRDISTEDNIPNESERGVVEKKIRVCKTQAL